MTIKIVSVSFRSSILFYQIIKNTDNIKMKVSVSFRSSILFYADPKVTYITDNNMVSVSFRSSILFYKQSFFIYNNGNNSFRLLSEFNSLLFYVPQKVFRQYKSCFRLLSEFNSLLLDIDEYCDFLDLLFPSPFGVQFSFILPKLNPYFIVYYFIIFVRILEIFIFLFLNNKKYTLTPIFKVSWRLLKKIIIFVFNFI